MKIWFVLSSMLLWCIPLFASFTLTPKSLELEVKKNPPQLKEVQLSLLGVQKSAAEFQEKFQGNLSFKFSHERTNEQGLISYQPVLSPKESFALQYSKGFKRGVGLSTSIYTSKVSTTNGMVTDGVTTGISAMLTVDLYKNFWGALSRSSDKILTLSKEKVVLQKKIQTKVFLTNLKKIYWALVANSESNKISIKLYQAAKQQLADAQKRYKSQVADIGEVARYQSQVAGRKAALLYLRYQKEQLLKNLKVLLPALAKQKIELGPYSMNSIVQDVLTCSAKLESLSQAPLQFTSYDELLDLSKSIYQQQKKVSRRYAMADVNFFLQAKNQSIARGAYGDSFSSFWDDRKEGISFGLTFTTSLDHRAKTTQEILQKIDELRYQKEQENVLGEIESYHSQIVNSVRILNEVIVQLQKNSSYLAQSLKEVERKYNQARITFRDYIREQNLLLESNLNEIKTKLEIIHTLLDYFTVFTETQCALNK